MHLGQLRTIEQSQTLLLNEQSRQLHAAQRTAAGAGGAHPGRGRRHERSDYEDRILFDGRKAPEDKYKRYVPLQRDVNDSLARPRRAGSSA
jgi:hypothetical protein